MAAKKKTTRKKKATRKKATTSTGGRGKAFKATPTQRAIVSAMLSVSVPQKLIAAAIGVSLNTIKRHFKDEIEAADGKAGTSLAINTLMSEMAGGGALGLKAAMFWLRTRENEKFSERRIQENIDRNAADQLGKITEEEARRIAENVIEAAEQNEGARETLKTPSIHDEPHGSA